GCQRNCGQFDCTGQRKQDCAGPYNGQSNPGRLTQAFHGETRVLAAIFKEEDFSMKTLKDAKVGETVTVAKVHGEGPVRRRIMDMGLTKGVQVYVRKVAPLGDPMELNIRGYELSVRKADAEMIELV